MKKDIYEAEFKRIKLHSSREENTLTEVVESRWLTVGYLRLKAIILYGHVLHEGR